MATITINGKTYAGNNVEIRNGVIKVDGVVQNDDSAKGAVEIRVIEGYVERLDTDLSVSAGRVGVVNAGGSVSCDNVDGSVTAGGSVSHG